MQLEDISLVEGAQDGGQGVLVAAPALHRAVQHLRLKVELLRQQRVQDVAERVGLRDLIGNLRSEVPVAEPVEFLDDALADVLIAEHALVVRLGGDIVEEGAHDFLGLAILKGLADVVADLLNRRVEHLGGIDSVAAEGKGLALAKVIGIAEDTPGDFHLQRVLPSVLCAGQLKENERDE